MLLVILRFIVLLLSGLITGVFLSISIGYNPTTLSYPAYIEQQQYAISTLYVVLIPILGIITLLICLSIAFLKQKDKRVLYFLIIAAGLNIICAIVSQWSNQSIDNTVLTWNQNVIPQEWITLRNRWWVFHNIRTALSFLAFCCIILSNLPSLSRHRPYKL